MRYTSRQPLQHHTTTKIKRNGHRHRHPPPAHAHRIVIATTAPYAHNQGLTASGIATINVGADRPLREQHAAEWLLPSSEASKDEPELRKRYVRDARRRRRRYVAYVERVPSPQPDHSHHRALRPSGDPWSAQWG